MKVSLIELERRRCIQRVQIGGFGMLPEFAFESARRLQLFARSVQKTEVDDLSSADGLSDV